MAVATPEHSFIQFTSASQVPAEEVLCFEQPDICLPVNQPDDISFQLLLTGAESLPTADEYYLVLLRSCDLNDTVNVYGADPFGSIEWVEDVSTDPYAESTGIIWGKITLEEFDFDELFAPQECFYVGIVKVEQREACCYDIQVITFPNTYHIDIDIDAINYNLGNVVCNSAYDIVDALNTLNKGYFDIDQGDICVEMTGHTYGTMTIGETDIPTRCDELTDIPILKYCSNCLQYFPSTCFTTRIKYRSDEDSFGFIYDDATFYNIVRLPFFLNNPQPKTQENVFRFSDGRYKMLSARFEKEFEGHVGHMNEDFHFKLSIALKHDDVQLMNHDDNTYKQVMAEGGYDIKWNNKPGTNIDSATAEFKVKESPYFNVNSNCV